MPSISVNQAAAVRDQLRRNALGILSEPFPYASGNASMLTISGSVYGEVVGFRAGDIVTGIVVAVNTNGATLTNAQVGVATLSGTTYTVVAASSDIKAQFTTGSTQRTETGAVSYTVPADGGYYIWFEATQSAGTMPTLTRVNGQTSVQVGSNPFSAGVTTGKTTIAVNDTGTVASSTTHLWLAAVGTAAS